MGSRRQCMGSPFGVGSLFWWFYRETQGNPPDWGSPEYRTKKTRPNENPGIPDPNSVSTGSWFMARLPQAIHISKARLFRSLGAQSTALISACTRKGRNQRLAIRWLVGASHSPGKRLLRNLSILCLRKRFLCPIKESPPRGALFGAFPT